MARPLRIDFAGGMYHVTSRGDRREPIYDDDVDRTRFLEILSAVIEHHNWLCHAWCLMTNHYHLVVETPDANLSKGMRQLNGVYAQASNRRHGRSGHVFQGRFTAILVDKDSYLLELTRYVVLNPVRAGIVNDPADWPWSSHGAMLGTAATPRWLSTDALLGQFGDRREQARERYRRFVADGLGRGSIWSELRQQIYLGDDDFVRSAQRRIRSLGDALTIPRAQRRAPIRSLEEIFRRCTSRDQAISQAYATGAYSYREIAEHAGVHRSTVRRIVQREMVR